MAQRLSSVLAGLSPPAASAGTLTLGNIQYDVPLSLFPNRLPHSSRLLDLKDKHNLENLHFMLQKYILQQDIFLVSQPGIYARRLALTFAQLINSEYEYIALHRDVGETELKQGREIRAGGNLVYVDSPAVQAAKNGRLLIIEGIEKAERGIMPVLNNLLENREMNLDDGTHIISQLRFHNLTSATSNQAFIPAHKNFRVIAIGASVPPYVGFPLDPPFRSRFQARFIDPLGSAISLSNQLEPPVTAWDLWSKIRDIILSTQYSSESRTVLDAVSSTSLPAFPQTALMKLRALLAKFPPKKLTTNQLTQLILTIHPGIGNAPPQAWTLLSRQFEESGLPELGKPSEVASLTEGLMGYRLVSITRETPTTVKVSFDGPVPATYIVPAGPMQLAPLPSHETMKLLVSQRFWALLTSMLQAHCLGWDIALVPPITPATASCSTSTLIRLFSQLLGYEPEVIHLYKEIGGRELIMRRRIEDSGATSWEPSTLIASAWDGKLLHLSAADVLGSTAGSLSRLLQDREVELWDSRRVVSELPKDDKYEELSIAHSSFRVISTVSKALPPKEWLSDEYANMFFTVPLQPMDLEEEAAVLLRTGCDQQLVSVLLTFAKKYRDSLSHENVQKNRKLGTRSLVRIASRIAALPTDVDLRNLLHQTLLAEFLPHTERVVLDGLLSDSNIEEKTPAFYPSTIVKDNSLLFPCPSSASHSDGAGDLVLPRFPASKDPEGAALVPEMEHFYDNSLQTGLMRELAIDLEVLGEHVVLLGNQGVGKNKIVDRLCQLLGRPREYVQLHRDTTVNQLLFTTSLEGGHLEYKDSPLLKAIQFGRIRMVDEADKAPEHVVAIFRSLAGQSELSLPDGRRIRPRREQATDIVVHPDFRLVLLANRPGYPFLGNQFLQVLGENVSTHSISNPDRDSEQQLLRQLAPHLDPDLIKRLVAAFQDLRQGYEVGALGYPYSLRELINLVRHLSTYPQDSLDVALRNIFDFDIYRPETMEKLAQILQKHGLDVRVGLESVREETEKSILDVDFSPKETSLTEPKEGRHDDEEHTGGNTFAGGTGGRDTAGLGGRGGYKRFYKGGDIKQVSDELKEALPEEIKQRAREMARQELQRRLEELDMTASDARGYGEVLKSISTHMVSLHNLLEHLAAKEEERVWVKRQTDGELDDSRLTEGLIGDAAVYKRRTMQKPEIGRPQLKPKRIKFLFDLSASMYRFQYDGRLKRSTETAAMLMETFDQLSRKEKYVWDMTGHSGDGPEVPLASSENPPAGVKDRWKVIEKMNMIPQYAFAGDYTVEALEKGVTEVAKFDADDWFLIAITDANFGRYQITGQDLARAMNRYPKVHTALICIGEAGEAVQWISKSLPGRVFGVGDTKDIPIVLRSILTTMVDK